MDTVKIKAILCAVENKSLSKAAEEFSYTPSAFSHIADSLEAELGVRILKRSHAGVEPTEEGLLLIDKMKKLVAAEKELLDAANLLGEKKEQKLKIGTYSSISTHLLPEILKAFKKTHPSVKVSISVGDVLGDWLDKEVADVVLADEEAIGVGEWVPMMRDPFVAVVPSDLFANRKSVRVEELYEFAYISTNESLLKNYFDEKNFKEVLRFDSVDDNSVLSMVKEKLGIAVLPSLILKKQIKGVRTLRLEPEITRTLGFAYKKNPRSWGAAKFIKFLKSEWNRNQ